MGDQRRQAGPDAEEPFVFRHYHRVLELHGRHLLPRSVDALGHTQLRQGPAHADHGNGTRSGSREVQGCDGWNCIQGEVDSGRSTQHSAFSHETVWRGETRKPFTPKDAEEAKERKGKIAQTETKAAWFAIRVRGRFHFVPPCLLAGY